jgi:hypothetical protein
MSAVTTGASQIWPALSNRNFVAESAGPLLSLCRPRAPPRNGMAAMLRRRFAQRVARDSRLSFVHRVSAKGVARRLSAPRR